MAKLYELDRSGRFDVLVLDTPPSRNALDFLDAPDRLTGFLEGRALRVFLAPTGLAAKVVGRGTSVVFSVLKRLTGVDLLDDLSVFFRALGGLVDGFKERADGVKALLGRRRRRPSSSSPRPSASRSRRRSSSRGKLRDARHALRRPRRQPRAPARRRPGARPTSTALDRRAGRRRASSPARSRAPTPRSARWPQRDAAAIEHLREETGERGPDRHPPARRRRPRRRRARGDPRATCSPTDGARLAPRRRHRRRRPQRPRRRRLPGARRALGARARAPRPRRRRGGLRAPVARRRRAPVALRLPREPAAAVDRRRARPAGPARPPADLVLHAAARRPGARRARRRRGPRAHGGVAARRHRRPGGHRGLGAPVRDVRAAPRGRCGRR